MFTHLRPALVLMVIFTLLTGLAYPLAMTGVANLIFPSQATGSLVSKGDIVVGSSMIGQNFTKPEYFHGRPSATTDTDPNDSTKQIPAPYNASNSGGSNLAPTTKALADRVKADVEALQADNPGVPVPGDLVTTSASGLDPDISPDAARFQIKRVAKARNLPEAIVTDLVTQHITGRLLGLIGEPYVNVLALNMALDGIKK